MKLADHMQAKNQHIRYINIDLLHTPYAPIPPPHTHTPHTHHLTFTKRSSTYDSSGILFSILAYFDSFGDGVVRYLSKGALVKVIQILRTTITI